MAVAIVALPNACGLQGAGSRPLAHRSSMSDIPNLLLQSLNPQTRKQAEYSLGEYSRQPAFVLHLLRLVLDATQDSPVRLAASVYLKNTVKLGWLEDVCAFQPTNLSMHPL
jgi:Importin-beta N-terminal domain